MTDIEIEERVQREAARRMRLHELKLAYELLHSVRVELKKVRAFVADEPLAHSGTRHILNELDTLMWNVETAIREGKS